MLISYISVPTDKVNVSGEIEYERICLSQLLDLSFQAKRLEEQMTALTIEKDNKPVFNIKNFIGKFVL
jgi:hypothetical protein